MEESGSQNIRFSNVYSGTTGNYNTLGITAFDSNNNTNLCGLEIVKDSDKITIRQPQDLTGINYREMDIPIGGSGIDTISARSSGSVSTISFAEGLDNKLTMVISPSTTDADNGFKVNTITPSSTGEAEFTFVSDVTTQVINGNTLRVEVNGVSGQVTLPTSGKQLVTSGDITQFISHSNSLITINKEFDIEYIEIGSGNYAEIYRTTISKGTYNIDNTNRTIRVGVIPTGISTTNMVSISSTDISITCGNNNVNITSGIINSESIDYTSNTFRYRLYA